VAVTARALRAHADERMPGPCCLVRYRNRAMIGFPFRPSLGLELASPILGGCPYISQYYGKAHVSLAHGKLIGKYGFGGPLLKPSFADHRRIYLVGDPSKGEGPST
jgi:hypothetical protein